jgi:hypothetical protein
MSHFRLIAKDLDVAPLLAQVDANPDLWGSRSQRQKETSPHRDASDIWLRYMQPSLIGQHDISQPHISVWYPEATRLSAVRGLVRALCQHLGGPLELGGILMTRIPAGKEVYWHNDRGPWHAEHFDLKVWLPLRANEQCINHVEDEQMVWRVGEAWHHSNMLDHRVQNLGDCERICLIVCFKRI